ncbi:MAG: hypothetical protein PWR03_743 [Tenuifilum sp.]|jgi:hypothetical protein|uniref:hypothetical protein n=1 Tax=Tenuifilum sp. TaxID=2760880 RepID=UPI0024AB1D01|nr:hypothetical protein [Tenuifilum sp.]MDI3526560.1 hypothetical protein [Tenuifilum sp.]
MKPLKFLEPFSYWLSRLALAAYLIFTSVKALTETPINRLSFYISLVMIILATCIVLGSFLRKQSLTVLAAISIAIILIYNFVIAWPIVLNSISILKFLVLASVLSIASRGNN